MNLQTPIKNALTLQEIVRPIYAQLQTVENILKTIGSEGEDILKNASQYVLSGGGKRLRAALVLFTGSIQANNPKENENNLIQVASAVELIHAATLVHDDIIDRAVIRRLRPTVNLEFGEDMAVLLGDFLYARAFDMIASVGDAKVTQWMARSTQEMCEGEIGQLKHRYRADLSLERYFSFIEKKTAALIAVSAKSGAQLGGLSPIHAGQLGQFGLNIGISFQIVDDLLDVIGSEKKIGKTVHTDTGNGKMTLPMILLLKEMQESEKKQFLNGFQSMKPEWDQIQSWITKYGIIDKTERYASEYYDRAIRALNDFDPIIQETLMNLSRFILKRDY